MAAVVAIRSGHAALRAELETNGAAAACRMLAEMGDGALSRRVGLALLRDLAHWCELKGTQGRAFMEQMIADYERHLDEGSLLPMLAPSKSANTLAKCGLHQLDDLGCYTFGAVVEWLAPGDWEDDELTEDDLDEAAPGCALRVLDCFEEAFVRADISIRCALRVAEVAIQREQDWRRGTNTKFDLVESSVKEVLEAIIEEARDEVSDVFATLAKNSLRAALEHA